MTVTTKNSKFIIAKDEIATKKGTSLLVQMSNASTIINSEKLLNKIKKMGLIAQLRNDVAELERESSTLKENVKNSKAEDSA